MQNVVSTVGHKPYDVHMQQSNSSLYEVRISSVFFRVITGRFPSRLRPDILTRSTVQWSLSGIKLPKREANCSAVDGFYLVELA